MIKTIKTLTGERTRTLPIDREHPFVLQWITTVFSLGILNFGRETL